MIHAWTTSQFWLDTVYTIQRGRVDGYVAPWSAGATHESFQYTERQRQGKTQILLATVALRRELSRVSGWHPSRETRTEFLLLIEKTRCLFRPPVGGSACRHT